jgi:hypothetical protein
MNAVSDCVDNLKKGVTALDDAIQRENAGGAKLLHALRRKDVLEVLRMFHGGETLQTLYASRNIDMPFATFEQILRELDSEGKLTTIMHGGEPVRYKLSSPKTVVRFKLDNGRDYFVEVCDPPKTVKQMCHELYGWAGLKAPELYNTQQGFALRYVALPSIGLSPDIIWSRFERAVSEQVYAGTWDQITA